MAGAEGMQRAIICSYDHGSTFGIVYLSVYGIVSPHIAADRIQMNSELCDID